MQTIDKMKYILVLFCALSIAACSGAGDSEQSSKIEKMANAAGKAQRIYWRKMQEHTVREDTDPDNGSASWRAKHRKDGALGYFDRAYAYGLQHLDQPSGFDALVLALEVSSDDHTDAKKIQDIHERLYENYLNTSEYAYVLQKIGSGRAVGHDEPRISKKQWQAAAPARYKRVTKLLSRAAKNATDPVVKTRAQFELANTIIRSLDDMGPAEFKTIQKRRKQANALLDEVIKATKDSGMTRLFPKDVSVLAAYQTGRTQAGTANGGSTSRPVRKRKVPTLHDLASKLQFYLNYLTIGRVLPSTIGTDLDGKPQDIAQYKGRVLLIDLWATWCGPCIAKFPHLRELKKKYAGRPFEVLGVSGDEEMQTVIDFVKETDMPWDIWFSGTKGGLMRKWSTKSLPTVFLIDHTGRVILKNPEDDRLDGILEHLVLQAENAKNKS